MHPSICDSRTGCLRRDAWQDNGVSGKNTEQTSADAERWLAEHGAYLYRYALFRLGDAETARDMVQETLIAAWKARDGFRGDSSARTWLVGILKHKITDHIRGQIRRRALADSLENDPTSDYFDANDHWRQPVRAWADDPEKLSSNGQFLKVLHDCIAALPERHRHVFTLRELEGEDTDAICKACDITPTNLHVIMHRARLALRQCLERHWFGDDESA